MKISGEMFHTWKKDPVTQELMSKLQSLYDGLNVHLASDNVVMHERSAQVAARLLGQKEGLGVILNVQLSDFEEESNENTSDSTQSAS